MFQSTHLKIIFSHAAAKSQVLGVDYTVRFSMCVSMSDKPFDAEACNIGGQVSATNGLTDATKGLSDMKNAPCIIDPLSEFTTTFPGNHGRNRNRDSLPKTRFFSLSRKNLQKNRFIPNRFPHSSQHHRSKQGGSSLVNL
jgi:hypothetical protein